MKNKKITLSLVSLAIFLSGVIPTGVSARPEKKEKKDGNNFLVGAVIGGLAAGAYMLGNALCKQSDEDLIRSAERVCFDADQYQSIAHRIIDVEYHHGAESALEEVLNLVATSPTYSMKNYNQGIQSILARLDSCQEALLKRIKSVECCHKSHAMHYAIDALMAKRAFLQPYSQFLTRHKDYFALVKMKNALNQKYAREFAACYYYRTNFGYFLNEIRTVAMNSAACNAYPYIAYVEGLARDRRDITTCIDKVSYKPYNRLLQASRDTSGWLGTIHGQALADPSYAQALRDREYNRLQEERLRLERERMHIAQQQQLAMPRVRLVHHKVLKPTIRAKFVI